MVKHQKIARATAKPAPTIITEKSIPQPTIDPKYANAPVRAVNFVEVGSMNQAQIQYMLSELSRMHDSARGGIHYFLPVRNGKIGTDIVFEQEWERIVRETCEVKNGEIVLKGGAKETFVIRERI